ncbi:MerR family transcriptional regulator [Ruminiclostridium herbifermentans]|uniref:MerR family transcriptional regulator n=1 Tax=Ruminiclostridium herbifermentans TaxID=2488810 RepID=A0A4U7JN88_9FIRM|nr:MerR family transcriptional regulator [Ruminiclostridium herbifermentans]QNU68465.1 MerR family transcriptional regulator [Ruminiclostridium herbifermentans]
MDVLKERYSITELSEYLNITDHALRFYEKEFGLKIPKDSRGRRYYTTNHANLMYQIKTMRDQGLELKAIRKILEDENIIEEQQQFSKFNGENLPAVINSSSNQLSSQELTTIVETLNTIKNELLGNVSAEIQSSRESLAKDILKSKLELGACIENSNRKLEIKLDKHFQEVDRSLTEWRERKNSSLSGKLKKLIGR